MHATIAQRAARATSLGPDDINGVEGFGAFVRGSTGRTYRVR